MDYKEVRETLETKRLALIKKLRDEKLSNEEKTRIQNSISNYEYILELTDMNHHVRGPMIH